MFACPKCGAKKDLRISAVVEMRLLQWEEADEFHQAADYETELEDGNDYNYEFDDGSTMACSKCKYVGIVQDFDKGA